MRADWFIELLQSWPAAAGLSRTEATQGIRLVKAASVSAGGRVACLGENPDRDRLRAFALWRAQAALDRYARAQHGAASFDRLIGEGREPAVLIGHLRNAVAHARACRPEAEAIARDTLYGEFLEWDRLEAAGRALEADSFAVDDVDVLRDAEYVKQVSAVLAQAESEILIAVGILVWDGTASHPVTPLVDALRSAIGRGVQVKILTGDLESQAMRDTKLDRAMRLTIKRLEEAGARIVATKLQRAFHIKAVVVDRRVVILGSHNWSGASFAEHAEVSLLLRASGLADALSRRLETLSD